ncbi:MAG: TetR/AcrR family transcriptional regulator [Burkholderiales bacterium]|nr:TetR/AcrR family transcriptional regulator [Burkholderiales bacterium]
MNAIALQPAAVRGAATREALLDAAEALIADLGFRAPSHRMIAAHARAQTALVNYHFGTKEMLFEAAIERRAARLCSAWAAQLAAIESDPRRGTEGVLRAWWRPFDELSREELPWRNYLCVIARLVSDADSGGWYQRHFGHVERRFRNALVQTLPDCDPDIVEAGLRYARCLFAEALLHRCGKSASMSKTDDGLVERSGEKVALLTPVRAVDAQADDRVHSIGPNGQGAAGRPCNTGVPNGYRESDSTRLIDFIANGIRGMARTTLAAAD